MAWRIEGAGFYYDFSETFDLIDYNRTNSVPSRRVHGREGEVIAKSSVRREMTIHNMRGIIKSGSVASTMAKRDRLESAVNAMPDEVYLVDTASGRRVAVRLVSSAIPRQPAYILSVDLFFRTSDKPFWENKTQTSLKTTAGRWITLQTGDVPSYTEIAIEGGATHPTLVQGNWNFCSHIHTTGATAINTGAGANRPYGQITGALSSPTQAAVRPSKYRYGRLLNGSTYSFASLACRTSKFAVMVRFRASQSWPTVADLVMADFNDGASALGTHHYFFAIRGSATLPRYVFGHSGATIGGAVTVFAANKDVDVSVWVDTAGTSINGATVKARMFENGYQIASKATFAAPGAGTLSKLWIGTNRGAASPVRQIVDEVYVWHQNVGDGFLKGEGNAQRQLTPDNKKLAFSTTVASANIFLIDTQKRTAKVVDTANATNIDALNWQSGEFFRVGDGNAHSRANVDTVYTSQVITSTFRYRKQYN